MQSRCSYNSTGNAKTKPLQQKQWTEGGSLFMVRC